MDGAGSTAWAGACSGTGRPLGEPVVRTSGTVSVASQMPNGMDWLRRADLGNVG